LKRDTLSIAGSVAMCMAFMGPATSVAFNTSPAAAGAGFALPLAIVLALIACLLVANTIAAFARKLPTAGFAYTYNTHGFGPCGGFMSGWLLLLSYGMVGPMLLAAIGEFSSEFIQTQAHVHVPWVVLTALFGGIVWGINAIGVSDICAALLSPCRFIGSLRFDRLVTTSMDGLPSRACCHSKPVPLAMPGI